MPEWLTIALALGGSTLIGLIVHAAWDHLAEKKRKIEEDAKYVAQQEQRKADTEKQEAWMSEVKNIVKPIGDKIDEIDRRLKLDQEATVVELRVSMMNLKDKLKEQGYATEMDVITWNELYEKYTGMGGNHLKDRVNKWKKLVNDLPEKED